MANNNTFRNTSLVTKYSLKAFLNALQLAKKVDRQIDEDNLYAGKVGETINIRRPVMFEATDGAVITSGQTDDIVEGTIPVTLDKRKKVVMNISSEQQTLNIEDAYERYIMPAMIELAQKVESDLAATYAEIPNLVGTPGTPPSTFLEVGAARQKLNELGVPQEEMKYAFYDPESSLKLADSLKAVFPETIAKTAIERAMIKMYAGLEIYENQSLKMHTVGSHGGTPLVKGADQDVTYASTKNTDYQTLLTDGWTASTKVLNYGDVITIAGVYAVNQRTRESTGNLQQFVVLDTAGVTSDASGNATITIGSPIITDGAYQTVTAAPADNAAITVKTGTAGSSYRQNLAFHKNAITLAMARLDTPQDGATSYREEYDGVSIRVVKQYDSTNDETRLRFDIFYAIKVQNRRFAVRTTG